MRGLWATLVFASLWAIGVAQGQVVKPIHLERVGSAQIRHLTLDSVEPLIRELAKPDVKAQRAALRFWAARGEEVDNHLLSIDDDDPAGDRVVDVRQKIVDGVDRCVDSPDPAMHQLAVRALCALGMDAKFFYNSLFICGTGMEITLGGMTEAALHRRRPSLKPDLIQLTGDPDPTVVLSAYTGLDPAGQAEVLDQVRGFLRSPNRVFRGIAVNSFHPANPVQAANLIGPLLDDPDIRIQECAEHALREARVTFMDLWPIRGELPRGALYRVLHFAREDDVQTHLKDFFALLHDSDPEVRASAMFDLRSADYLSDNLLQQCWLDPDPKVKVEALWLISKVQRPGLREYVRQALLSRDEGLRHAGLLIVQSWPDHSLVSETLKAIEAGVPDSYMVGVSLWDPSS